MNDEAVIFTIFSCLGLISTGVASYAMIFNKDLGNRILKMGKSSWAPWTKREGADWVLKGLTFLAFLFFLGTTCMIFYGWLSIVSGSS